MKALDSSGTWMLYGSGWRMMQYIIVRDRLKREREEL